MDLMVPERGIIPTFCGRVIFQVYIMINLQIPNQFSFSYSLVTCEKSYGIYLSFSGAYIFILVFFFIEYYLIKPFCQECRKGFGKIFSQENK